METENTMAVAVLDTFDIKEDVKKDITASFAPFLDGLKDLLVKGEAIEIESEDQKEEMAEARDIRLAIQKKRTGMDKERKKVKDIYLRPGQAIDAVFRAIKGEIEPVEEHLKEQEEFAKRLEEKRLEALLDDRIATLAQYEGEFITEGYNLREMADETFDQLIESFEFKRKQRLEQEKIVEQARINQEKADAEEKERMRAENERLTKEAEERELKAENERLEREAREAAEHKEREAKEVLRLEALRVEKAKQDAILAEERKKREETEKKLQDKLQAEREERIRLQAAEDARKAAEEAEKAKSEAEEKRAEKAREEAERAAKMTPDKIKLEKFVSNLEELELPDVESKEASGLIHEFYTRIKLLCEELRGDIEDL